MRVKPSVSDWNKQDSKARASLDSQGLIVSQGMAHQSRVRGISPDMGVISMLREPQTKACGSLMDPWVGELWGESR